MCKPAERFQEIGVNRQYGATSMADANRQFERSCECCCNKGVQLDCDRCDIAFVHSLVVAIFADINNQRGA